MGEGKGVIKGKMDRDEGMKGPGVSKTDRCGVWG